MKDFLVVLIMLTLLMTVSACKNELLVNEKSIEEIALKYVNNEKQFNNLVQRSIILTTYQNKYI